MLSVPPPHPTIRTFGRRLGRPLKGTRRAALDKLPLYEIPPATLAQDGTINPRALFPTPREKIWFEIGFGSGEHLLARVKQRPQDGFIGAEPYVNGMSALLAALPDPGPQNLRLHMNDALSILERFQDNSLDGLYILNPDPWPKKRHHKRRIISDKNLDLFSCLLKPGGSLIFSTDVAELAEWTNDIMNARQDFEMTYESHTPPPDWPLTTRYMAWGISEGRKPHFLVWAKSNFT